MPAPAPAAWRGRGAREAAAARDRSHRGEAPPARLLGSADPSHVTRRLPHESPWLEATGAAALAPGNAPGEKVRAPPAPAGVPGPCESLRTPPDLLIRSSSRRQSALQRKRGSRSAEER